LPDLLNSLDITLFRFINGSMQNPVFDVVMPFLTDLNKQRIVLVLVAATLLWMVLRGSFRVRLSVILLIVTIIVSDQLSSSVIKYWLERPRPCQYLHNVHLLVSCGSGYSFPSSHAVNNFAAAIILAFFFPRMKWWVFGFAVTVAFSRIYVGVHYPADVLGGSIIGLACGGFILFFYYWLERITSFLVQRRIQKADRQ